MKLLLVEDEVDFNEVIKRYLEKNKHNVDAAYDGEEALDFLAVGDYDLVILDVMMPRKNGFEVIEEMRNRNDQTPVLFLTAKDQVEDRVQGLNLGADDYLVKPFDFEELLARVNAVVRRHSGSSTSLVEVDELGLNLEKQQVYLKGEELDLTAKEYQILEYLMLNKNHILSKDRIRENVWDLESEAESNVVEVLIKNIRKKIDVGREKSYITTKRNLGYVIYD